MQVSVEVEPRALAEKLTHAIDIRRTEYTVRLTPALVRALHERALKQMTSALQSFGYYRAEVVGELREDAGTWRALYRIDKGPPTIYRRVNVNL
ncbi:MAG: hypothetical protein OES09_07060, partial [Gammaproteobacteria bacterium]|nr:hypothetical protein [Gammaproteobacteria bacterium]